MPRRVRNLALISIAPIVMILLIFFRSGAPGQDRPAVPPADDRESPQAVEPDETGEVSPPSAPGRLYSIGLYRLKGLSPMADPGTTIEIWVSWSPEASEEPKLQKLVRRATLVAIEPGAVPEAPQVATLSLPVEDVPQLIWGEIYGDLAVAVLPD